MALPRNVLALECAISEYNFIFIFFYLVHARVYNKIEEYRTVKMYSKSNVILHVWHGIRVT